MIQANELRIGNWVKTFDFYCKITTLGVTTLGYQVDDNRTSTTYSALQPIPLTPEILEKCGFELFPWGWVKKATNDFGVRLNVHSFSYDVSGNNSVQLKYLHQLQNLYFALTGQELQINL